MGKLGAAAVLVGVLLAGCGSSSATDAGSSSALRSINSAVRRTEDAGSAHFVTVSEASGPSSTGSSTARTASRITSVGDITFDGPDLRITSTVQSGATATSHSTTAISIGGNLYMSLASDPTGWVRSPYHQAYPYLGAVQASALTTTTGPVTVAGAGVVDGQPATRYLVPIRGSTRTVALSNDENQPYHGRFRIAPFVLSVWLDRAGRIVRTQATQVTSSSVRSQVVVEQSTTTLSNFGEAVRISAPSSTTGP